MSGTVRAYGVGEMLPRETIGEIATLEFFIGGLRVSVGGSHQSVSIYVSATEITDPGGPQRLLTEIHNINQLQAAMTFRAVDGDKMP